ncbi:hypothetical protein SLS64_007192 [Diaporthe eres]
MSEELKVIIVGGSIAGLTLAHCLERLGISFEVLERNEDISPQLGASIGILPNGARILAQLGLFEAIEKEVEPMKTSRISYSDGFAFQSDFPASWLQTTAAGQEYKAHLVVGADGVHSTVRSEMWKHAAKLGSSAVDNTTSFSALKLEYACIYGISKQVPNIEAGVWYNLLDKQITIHLIGVKAGKVFWFLIVKQEAKLRHGRLTTEDARRICENLQSRRISPTLTFGDLWKGCYIFKMTPLEEGWFSLWHAGRLVITGDAVRKMAPSIGQGANMAIEDAAVLANALWRVGLDETKLETEELDRRLADALQYYSTSERISRTKTMCARSEFLVRLQAHDGWLKAILARYVIPLLGDVPASLSAQAIRAGPLLEFVDVPSRSRQQTRGWIGGPSWLTEKRLLISAFLACLAAALPLLKLAIPQQASLS